MQIVGMKHLTFILTLSLISFFLIVGCSEQSAIKQQDSALIKKLRNQAIQKDMFGWSNMAWVNGINQYYFLVMLIIMELVQIS